MTKQAVEPPFSLALPDSSLRRLSEPEPVAAMWNQQLGGSEASGAETTLHLHRSIHPPFSPR